MRPETHARMSGTVVQSGDLLFNITGASIGRCALVPEDFDEANVSQHVSIVRPITGAFARFLHLVLTSRLVQQAVMDVQVGVSREGLSIAKLGVFPIPVPPLHSDCLCRRDMRLAALKDAANGVATSARPSQASMALGSRQRPRASARGIPQNTAPKRALFGEVERAKVALPPPPNNPASSPASRR